jgi:hypothetical protein
MKAKSKAVVGFIAATPGIGLLTNEISLIQPKITRMLINMMRLDRALKTNFFVLIFGVCRLLSVKTIYQNRVCVFSNLIGTKDFCPDSFKNISLY